MNFRKKMICAGMALLSSGCAIQQSANIKTSGLRVQYAITGDSKSGASASAQFTEADTVGIGTTYIQLSTGDTVTVNGLPLVETDPLLVSYGTGVAYQVGGTYTFTFTRTGETPYVSTVTLPDPVSITSPADGAVLARAQPIILDWTPGVTSTDNVVASLSTNGNTVGGYYSQMLMPDPGTVTIGASYTTTAPTGSQPPPGPAPATTGELGVSRQRQGTMPASLAGTITATQNGSVNITLH